MNIFTSALYFSILNLDNAEKKPDSAQLSDDSKSKSSEKGDFSLHFFPKLFMYHSKIKESSKTTF